MSKEGYLQTKINELNEKIKKIEENINSFTETLEIKEKKINDLIKEIEAKIKKAEELEKNEEIKNKIKEEKLEEERRFHLNNYNMIYKKIVHELNTTLRPELNSQLFDCAYLTSQLILHLKNKNLIDYSQLEKDIEKNRNKVKDSDIEGSIKPIKITE